MGSTELNRLLLRYTLYYDIANPPLLTGAVQLTVIAVVVSYDTTYGADTIVDGTEAEATFKVTPFENCPQFLDYNRSL